MAKYTVLDTNVLLDDANSVFDFENVVIPMSVIVEIDNKKNLSNEIGFNARRISKILDELKDKGNLIDGIKTKSGTLKISYLNEKNIKKLPLELQDITKLDNVIIATAFEIKSNCVLISNDVNVRIKCSTLGIKSEKYSKVIKKSENEDFSGINIVDVSEDFFKKFKTNKCYKLDEKEFGTYLPNEFISYESSNDFALGRYDQEIETVKEIYMYKEIFGIKPKNIEQQLAFDILLDDNIKLVSLSGKAGTGKTICAIAAALHQVLVNKKYDRVIIARSIVQIGKETGSLPGSLEEKIAPFFGSIMDNLDIICQEPKDKDKQIKLKKFKDSNGEFKTKEWKYYDKWIEEQKIVLMPISFLRGRSLSNSIIISEESQNMSCSEMKTLITRIGENSKLILTGDPEQIDVPQLDSLNNGLSYIIEKFKSQAIAAHIKMIKGERSKLATIASQIL